MTTNATTLERYQAAANRISEAEAEMKLIANEVITEHAEHCEGEVIDGHRSMSGKPTRMMVTNISVRFDREYRTNQYSGRACITYTGVEMKKNGTPGTIECSKLVSVAAI